MNAFAYIESPYQLLNAISFFNEKKYEQVKIIFRDNGSLIQKQQVLEIIKNKQVSNLEFIYIPAQSRLKFLYILANFSKLIYSLIQYRTIVIGDARSVVAKVLLPLCHITSNKVVMVDDGLYLLSYIDKIMDKSYLIYSKIPLEDKLSSLPKTRLSFIEDKVDMISTNNVTALNVIGMKLTEIGFMELDFYLLTLDKLRHKYGEYKLNYFAHRGESEEKLDKIKYLGFDIVRPNIPLEEFLSLHEAPKGIYVTFYSTALFNLSRAIDECKFIALDPGPDFWPKNNEKNIMECYELFRLAGICIEEVN